MSIFSTSSQRRGRWKWWVATAAVIFGLLAYHASSAWRFVRIKRKAQVVESAIAHYPSIRSNITVRALSVKGVVVVEGEVKTASDLVLLKKTIESTGIPSTMYVRVNDNQ